MLSQAKTRGGDPRNASAAPLAHGPEFAAALSALSRDIHDPVAKLRFLRESLVRYRDVDEAVRSLPTSPLRRLLFNLFGLDGLQRGVRVLDALKRTAASTRARARAAAAVAIVLVAAGTLALTWRRARPAPPATTAAPAAASDVHAATPAFPPPAPKPAAPMAETASSAEGAPAPGEVWLVERGDGWEQYSNGLRIDTSNAVDHAPRSFRVFEPGLGLRDELFARPAGILFHTSESDVWPLEAGYNENLRDSSQRLLRYIRREKLYNYLVDRFGRAYRVVPDEQRANHAGFSIWEAEGRVYLNLNNSFLGICFESRWEGGRALPITAAQLAAGRALTDALRQRWGIGPEMCVTHGLTSVNPRKHYIGHHVDWARGFPFAAFGLPDHYRRPAPSVALFGFGYDGDFLKAVGEPWEGVRSAEADLEQEAQRRGTSVEKVRRERQRLYDDWLAAQARDEAGTRVVRAARAGRRRAAGFGPGAAPGSRLTRGTGG
jgi:hypothetical protein